MKKKLALPILLLFCGTVSAQTLFTYGKQAVDREEFLKAFNKNNAEDTTAEAKKIYLEQFYIPFRLKVQAARDMRLDTLPSLKYELINYKRQITEDYLLEEGALEELCKEAYDRSLTDIRLSHIFIPFDEAYIRNPEGYMQPETTDTTAAYRQVMAAYSALQQGADFTQTALEYSKDPEVKTNNGDIGFITVFSLPYHIESIAYTLDNGKFSEPYKSKAGYHIFQKTGERPAFGSIKGAQILLAFPPGIMPGEKQTLRKRADSLYRALQSGSDFDQLARQYSSDFNAATTGGALNPDFKIGRYEKTFEDAVMGLTKDGDYTRPFETAYGIHIVQRHQHVPVISDSLQAVTLFKNMVLNDTRIKISNERQDKNILAAVGYRDQFNNDALLWQVTDSLVKNSGYTLPKKITPATVIFSFGNESRTLKDWVDYVNTLKNNYRPGTEIPYAAIMQHYVKVTANQYYRENLDLYNEAFRAQLKEFEEGNLFFEVMGRQVWNKGADNEAALKKYYNANKSRYVWGESVNAVLFTALDAQAAQEIKSNPADFVKNWRKYANNTEGSIIADSTRFETAYIPGYKSDMPENSLSVLSEYSSEGPAGLLFILSRIPGGTEKRFEEARGFVINDYQSELDKKWITSLKKKYRVKINDQVLRTL
ncbi:MAG: peptidylprolyl isomerase [Chitinophagaceae bacterium]|nr:peptidylprolyl isomerase [Chitinophagaceae bacterium]MCW5925517.1 peptidylprolyl isomerase [Chitinophagaceae bacterium]